MAFHDVVVLQIHYDNYFREKLLIKVLECVSIALEREPSGIEVATVGIGSSPDGD